jgi:hypothetical protein
MRNHSRHYEGYHPKPQFAMAFVVGQGISGVMKLTTLRAIRLKALKKGTGPLAGTARRVLRTTGPVTFFRAAYPYQYIKYG